MVIPYQIWMLQRVDRVLATCTTDAVGPAAIEELLAGFWTAKRRLEVNST